MHEVSICALAHATLKKKPSGLSIDMDGNSKFWQCQINYLQWQFRSWIWMVYPILRRPFTNWLCSRIQIHYANIWCYWCHHLLALARLTTRLYCHTNFSMLKKFFVGLFGLQHCDLHHTELNLSGAQIETNATAFKQSKDYHIGEIIFFNDLQVTTVSMQIKAHSPTILQTHKVSKESDFCHCIWCG